MNIKICHLIFLAVPSLIPIRAYCQQPIQVVSTVPDWSKLAKQLEEMLELDQVTRKKIAALKRQTGTTQQGVEQDELGALQQKVVRDDAENLAKLKEIVSQYGWPRKSIVGSKAAIGGWVVLQHADAKYQAEIAPLIREAVAAGEADKANLALLEDRVLVRQNLPQLYGSQVSSVGAFVNLFPVKDESNLDKRRAEVGLEPICTYLKRFVAPTGQIGFRSCIN